jgi:hypothetical protein
MTNVIPLHAAEQLFSGSFPTSSSSSSAVMTTSVVTKFLSSIHSAFFISAIIMLISIVPSIVTKKWRSSNRIQHE